MILYTDHLTGPPVRGQPGHGRADRPASQGAGRPGAGRRAAHHRLAPGPASPCHGVARDRQPLPGPPRAGHPGPGQAAPVVVCPVRGRAAQPVLAIRFHPVPAGRRSRRRDLDMARRPFPLRPVRHRAPPGHRSGRAGCLPGGQRAARHPGLHPDRQRHGLHHPPARARQQPPGSRTAPPRCSAENGKPNHPQTQGKVERFQQTLKKWLAARPAQPAAIAALQALLDEFTDLYNTRRPHRSLPHQAVPATAYAARPKATPGPFSHAPDQQVRTRTTGQDGKILLSLNGQRHHIATGRQHARTRVLILLSGLDTRIINAATSELIRELTINPDRGYQPTGQPPGRPQDQHPK